MVTILHLALKVQEIMVVGSIIPPTHCKIRYTYSVELKINEECFKVAQAAAQSILQLCTHIHSSFTFNCPSSNKLNPHSLPSSNLRNWLAHPPPPPQGRMSPISNWNASRIVDPHLLMNEKLGCFFDTDPHPGKSGHLPFLAHRTPNTTLPYQRQHHTIEMGD